MKKIEISIYVLVPLIFGLLSILSFIVSFQTIDYCRDLQISPRPFLWGAGALVSLVSALAGYLIIGFVLKPAERFIEKARLSSVVRDDGDDKEGRKTTTDQMGEFTRIFDKVSQALDIMDVEHLFPNFIGTSRSMRQVLSQVVKVAHTESTVLILGESGTGKELIAESIVELSRRKGKPFVRVNCAAITPSLMESELFGHEPGAFTGAVSRKRGCFEQADQGTLFLDEIGEMPLELQVKLLRVLQERSFFRVGGDSLLTVDVRIIAATNKNLEAMVADGIFREDLFYRVNVFPIFLPPLRQRSEDVELLATHFLGMSAPGKSFDGAVMDFMKNHSWPGNVRELENMVERAAVLAGTRMVVTPEDVPAMLKSPQHLTRALLSEPSEGDESMSLDESLKEIEKRLICEALKETMGVQVKAAERLGINQRSLWNRIKKYGIDVAPFKALKH